MRTKFEELDIKQEKEVEGYYSKRAVFMWCLVIIVCAIGYIRWNIL